MNYTIASYNIENMKKMFKKNRFIDSEANRAEAAASTLASVSPHIAGIVEASDKIGDNNYFLENSALSEFNFKVAKSEHKRGKQDLLIYYRDPFEVVSIDSHYEFYTDWLEDIDGDTIKEQLHFERKPLEVLFRDKTTQKELLVILVSFKSKGVFSTTDIHLYEHLALANRKKLYGQSKKVRQRVENLMESQPDLPIIVMGDINDEPGLDHFQKIVGASAVETIMGDIYHPEKIMHNTLWHEIEAGNNKEVWTTEYPDPIVANFKKHRAWLDHIFVSPNMLSEKCGVKLIENSGAIGEKSELASSASDHFPIYCSLDF
jgi:hypothetical protein